MHLDQVEWEENELMESLGRGDSASSPQTQDTSGFLTRVSLPVVGSPTFPFGPGPRGFLHTDCQVGNWGRLGKEGRVVSRPWTTPAGAGPLEQRGGLVAFG